MLEVRLHSIQNTTARGRELAQQAVALLGQIVNTPQFLSDVGSARYSYTARCDEQGRFVQRTDNDTIVQMIRSGHELRGGARGVLDLKVVIRKFSLIFRKTMGSVQIPDPTIYTNRRFFDGWIEQADVLSMAAHWMHEWMHTTGFYHDDRSGDDNDVPYTVGTIAYRIGKGLPGRPLVTHHKAAKPAASYLDVRHDAPCPVAHGGVPADLFDDSEQDDIPEPTPSA